jgi:hypothetical protein
LLRSAQVNHAFTTSSNTKPAPALFKKGPQLRKIIFAGLQGDRVDVVPSKHPRKFLLAFVHETAKTRSRGAVGCVDFNLIAGLGVFQRNDADVWQHPFSFIVNVDRHEIVPPSTYRQRSRKIGGLKIRNEENNGASRDDFIQIVECQCRIRAASLWFEKQDLSDESQRVRAAFLRRDKKFNAIGKENEPDLVIIPNRAESEQARDFRGQFPF